MTETLEQFAFVCVGLGFLMLLIGALCYFVVGHQWRAWACVVALILLGAAVFREVRLRQEVDNA